MRPGHCGSSRSRNPGGEFMNESRGFSDLDLEATELLVSRSVVRDVFLDLTDHGRVELRTNPLEPRFAWEGRGRPSDRDIEIDAALRLLERKGYIDGVTHQGRADFVVRASDKAFEVRRRYDQLAIELKDRIPASGKHPH